MFTRKRVGRMSRENREETIIAAIDEHYARDKRCTTASIAARIGIGSSTYLRSTLYRLWRDSRIECQWTIDSRGREIAVFKPRSAREEMTMAAAPPRRRQGYKVHRRDATDEIPF